MGKRNEKNPKKKIAARSSSISRTIEEGRDFVQQSTRVIKKKEKQEKRRKILVKMKKTTQHTRKIKPAPVRKAKETAKAKNPSLQVQLGNHRQYKFMKIRRDPKYKGLLSKSIVASLFEQFDSQKLELGLATSKVAGEALSCIEEHLSFELCSWPWHHSFLILIANVSFPRLADLFLKETSLSSLEVLPRISMPKLRRLQISERFARDQEIKLVSLRPLRKANFPNLLQFQLHGGTSRLSFIQLSEANFPKLELLGFPRTDFIYDSQYLGCVTKYMSTTVLIKIGYHVYGTDISRKQIKGKLSENCSKEQRLRNWWKYSRW